MNTFGTIKSKILKKLTESYISNNKSEIKEIFKIIKSNKDFKDLYLFYEDVENKFIEDPETAKWYAEEISVMLENKQMLIENTCNLLSDRLDGVVIENNSVYDALDHLLDFDNFRNVEKKVRAKKRIYDHVTSKKNKEINESSDFTKNESLLHAVMINEFNSYYDEVLTEEEKVELKSILSISKEDLEIKMNLLREELLSKINKILSEGDVSKRNDVVDKLETVKNEVNNSVTSKYNYYKLKNLLTDIE